MVHGSDLVPMSQMEHFVISRRLFQMGQETGVEQLKEITAPTRGLYEKISAIPESAKGLTIRDDGQSRKADANYRLAPTRWRSA